jgi:hypothetical protein
MKAKDSSIQRSPPLKAGFDVSGVLVERPRNLLVEAHVTVVDVRDVVLFPLGSSTRKLGTRGDPKKERVNI